MTKKINKKLILNGNELESLYSADIYYEHYKNFHYIFWKYVSTIARNINDEDTKLVYKAMLMRIQILEKRNSDLKYKYYMGRTDELWDVVYTPYMGVEPALFYDLADKLKKVLKVLGEVDMQLDDEIDKTAGFIERSDWGVFEWKWNYDYMWSMPYNDYTTDHNEWLAYMYNTGCMGNKLSFESRCESIRSRGTPRISKKELDNFAEFTEYLGKDSPLLMVLSLYRDISNRDVKIKWHSWDTSDDYVEELQQIMSSIEGDGISSIPEHMLRNIYFDTVSDETLIKIMSVIYAYQVKRNAESSKYPLYALYEKCKRIIGLSKFEQFKRVYGDKFLSIYTYDNDRYQMLGTEGQLNSFMSKVEQVYTEEEHKRKKENNMGLENYTYGGCVGGLAVLNNLIGTEECSEQPKHAVNLRKYTGLTTQEEIEKLRSMSIIDIESYGSNIQQAMSQTSKTLLERANMVELGGTQDKINELQDVVKKHNKLLPILQSPLRKLRKFSNNFVKVQERLDEIEQSLTEQCDKLTSYVSYMEEQVSNLNGLAAELRVAEDSLSDYAKQLEGIPEESLRLQSVTSRFRAITSTRVMAEQSQAEALMIVGEQREVKAQLEQVIMNALPAIHIQAVNSVGIRVTKETQDIIKKTRELTGNIIVQNANDVKTMAIELQNNRTKSVVEDDKLLKAQNILNEAMNEIINASEQEAVINKRLSDSLRERAKENKKFIERLTEKTENDKRRREEISVKQG